VLKEGELIGRIRTAFSGEAPDLILGIGDDTAVVRGLHGYTLYTKDLLIEDVHFLRRAHPPRLLGKKSLNVNLSDIAAMGGVPRYALLGLGCPQELETDWLEAFLDGFRDAAEAASVLLIGGDVARSEKIAVSVTAVGEAERYVTRGGAHPGDGLYVSGTPGDSGQGLELLKKGFQPGDDPDADSLLLAHLDPTPRLVLGEELGSRAIASAMIDLSDGPAVDLGHICQASGCGAVIESRLLPLSEALRRFQAEPVFMALHGGEDYELLFTVPPDKEKKLDSLRGTLPIIRIGRMIKEPGVFLEVDGECRPLKPAGFSHFG
jgi:thiamine-monophosphate kinase